MPEQALQTGLAELAELDQVSMEDLAKVAEDARSVLDQVHRLIQQPNPTKAAPTFTSPYIADLCKVDKTQIRNLAAKFSLPYGKKIEGSKAREYTLEDAILWSKTIGGWPTRPAGKPGKVIAVVNYKGGVAKTSTTVALAQGLTLRGLKVLLVDSDGQGTATQLCGINPEEHVEEEQTIMPYIYGDEPDLRYAVQSTYWHNLSLIPASSIILAAEFALPGRAVQTPGFEFWNVLKKGIEPLRDEFDVILFDTSPSLSHLTVNAMLAADALIMPCPPESLDFASSVQFWGLFTDLVPNLRGAAKKRYDFMTVILTKVQPSDGHRLVKPWMKQAYGKHMNMVEVPESAAARMAAAQLKTIYDLSKPDGTAEAYRRYKDPVDKLCDQVLDKLAISWRV
jgi:chromosome partitioning protein